MLNEDQKDALREYMSLYIGHAASLLSEMVEKRVHLMIPDIQLIDSQIEAEGLDLITSFLQSYVVSSSIGFGTAFSGEAKLIFPKDKIKDLVRLCIGDDLDEESSELTDTDFDAIREIGNIILNAVVGSLGNLVEVKLDYSLPEVNVIYFPEEVQRLVKGNQTYILVIRNVFTVDEANVEGAIIVVLSMEAIADLLHKIDGILSEAYE